MKQPFIAAVAIFLMASSAAHAEYLLHCPAGRWEGYQVGFRSYSGEGGQNGPNGIGYPEMVIVVDEGAAFGDGAYIKFGANYASPGGSETGGVVLFRSPEWTPADYVVIHSRPQQIVETFTIDLKSGATILNQTIGDRLGISVDSFKRHCDLSKVNLEE